MRLAALAAVALAVAAAFAAGAGPARAYVDQGRAWPGRVITYHNDVPADAPAVRAAVHDWNTSGVAVRFVPVPAAQAEVSILAMQSTRLSNLEKTPGAGGADALGYASVGYVPHDALVPTPSGGHAYGAHVWLVRIGSRDSYGITLSPGTMERVAVHEFGHVLGLGHEHRVCAVMQPILNEGCGITHPWRGLCNDPLQPDDVRGAVALYGGHEPSGGKRLCTISPRPTAPHRLSATLHGRRRRNLTLSWRSPGGVTLRVGQEIDPYSLDGRATIQAYDILASRRRCPTRQHNLLERESTRAGASMKVPIYLSPGSWCIRVRIGDAFRRWGRPATLHVTVPQPPALPVASSSEG